MKWKRFDLQTPDPRQCMMVVWYKGTERHLAVAWDGVERMKKELNIQDDDRLAYWTELTDPELPENVEESCDSTI